MNLFPSKLAKLLAEVGRQLDALALLVKFGTLVDATRIAVTVKRLAYGPRRGQSARSVRATMKRRKSRFG